jgi:hypothetical protein
MHHSDAESRRGNVESCSRHCEERNDEKGTAVPDTSAVASLSQRAAIANPRVNGMIRAKSRTKTAVGQFHFVGHRTVMRIC